MLGIEAVHHRDIVSLCDEWFSEWMDKNYVPRLRYVRIREPRLINSERIRKRVNLDRRKAVVSYTRHGI